MVFDITIQITIEHFISYLRDSSKVTHYFRTSGEKNLASNNSNWWKHQARSKVCCKAFHHHRSLFYVGGTLKVQWRNRQYWNDEKHLEDASFSFIQLSLRMVALFWENFFTSCALYFICLCRKTFWLTKKKNCFIHLELISCILAHSKSLNAQNC